MINKVFDEIKRIIGQYRSLLVMNAVLLVVTVILMMFRPIDHIRDYVVERQDGEKVTYTEVYGDMVVTQSFVSDSNADSFELFMLSAKENYHGNFRVDVYDNEGKHTYGFVRSKLDIADAAKEDSHWLPFRMKNNRFVKGAKYTIRISAPDLTDGCGILLGSVPERAETLNGEFAVDGVLQPGSLAFAVYRDRGNPFALIAILLIFVMANIWQIFREREIEYRGAAVLIGTGLIMLLIMAPASQPDEHTHYYTAFRLSSLMMGRENLNEMEEEYYLMMDTVEMDSMSYECPHSLTSHWNCNSSFSKLLTEFWNKPVSKDGIKTYLRNTYTIDYPVSYLPQALGITLGRLLRGNYLQVYSLGRIFNLFIYIALAMLAVKLIPCNKHLMLFIAVIPMAMHQAASMSYDAIVNALALVFFAYILKVIDEGGPFTWKKALVAAFLMYLLGPLKVIYCVLSLLVLVIPGYKFQNLKDRILKILLVPTGAVAAMVGKRIPLILDLLSGSSHGTAMNAGSAHGTTVSFYTVAYVFEHPFRYARLLITSVVNSINALTAEAIGYRFGGLTLTVSEILFASYMILLVAAAFFPEDTTRVVGIRQKAAFLGSTALGIGLIAAAFSISYTLYGSMVVVGMQGRYYIPFAAPVLYSIASEKISLLYKKENLIIPFWIIWLGYIFAITSRVTYGI